MIYICWIHLRQRAPFFLFTRTAAPGPTVAPVAEDTAGAPRPLPLLLLLTDRGLLYAIVYADLNDTYILESAVLGAHRLPDETAPAAFGKVCCLAEFSAVAPGPDGLHTPMNNPYKGFVMIARQW